MIIFGFGAFLTALIGFFFAWIVAACEESTDNAQKGKETGWLIVCLICIVITCINIIAGFFAFIGMFWASIMLKR